MGGRELALLGSSMTGRHLKHLVHSSFPRAWRTEGRGAEVHATKLHQWANCEAAVRGG
eukprot:CAMPEP_0171900314 /NCGR_PEP_ID=MMETSP0992-20121227/49713_1 /TAXON_ID=483369 /ORGANISM="non described non described, Strain CCMP2098" /LENGTH=57 /DNA_ID=CAMNT_0012528721 /DNA_START=345 /DNA_END=518 /DNA_ORIENTATION=-